MLQTLLGLKKAASGHAAALAAEDRGRFENEVQWEMQCLNQETQTLAQRLRECSKEVQRPSHFRPFSPVTSPGEGGNYTVQVRNCQYQKYSIQKDSGDED